ncbi:MAG: hypothetical protein R3E12_14025 [Candidatus Eisenbacteria bacterium]
MKSLFLALISLFAGSALARAEIPSGNVTVVPSDLLEGLVFCPSVSAPSPASVNTITVRNDANMPIAGAEVELLPFGATAENLCSGTVLTGTTNAAGQVVLTLAGGGLCVDDIYYSAAIRVWGFTVRAYRNIKSLDFDGASGNLRVDLQDLTQFSAEFLDNVPNVCHDYDNNGNTGLEDVIIFGPAFTRASSCSP